MRECAKRSNCSLIVSRAAADRVAALALSALCCEIMNSYNLDNLYGHRFYIRPERLCWEPWFAWHPVQLIYWCDEYPMQEYPIKLGRVVWLSQLLRRRVIDHQAGPGPGQEFAPAVNHWEYTTVFNLLKWGHSE